MSLAETRIKGCLYGFTIHIPADEYQLYASVAVFFIPNLLKFRIFPQILFLKPLRCGSDPQPLVIGAKLTACLLKYIGSVSVPGKPKHTLAPYDAARPLLRELVKFRLVKGAASIINEGSDAILLSLSLTMMVMMVVVMAMMPMMLIVIFIIVMIVVMLVLVIIEEK